MTATPNELVRRLLPCPFCGNRLSMRSGVNGYGRCETEDCWVKSRALIVPLDDATQVGEWNRRATALEATASPVVTDAYWHSIDTAPEDQHVILATTGGFVGEAIMLLDETTGKQKWAWALGPVHPNHVPLGWQHMPSPIHHPIPRDDRDGGFDGPTGAD